MPVSDQLSLVEIQDKLQVIDMKDEKKRSELSGKLRTTAPSLPPEFGARLSAICRYIGTRKEAASVAGVSTDSLHRYMRGEIAPPINVVAALAVAANKSIDWVVHGEAYPSSVSELGADEQQWLHWYRQIKPGDRELVEPVVRGFADRGKRQLSGLELEPDEAQWLEWYRQIKRGDREVVEPIVRRLAGKGQQQQIKDTG